LPTAKEEKVKVYLQDLDGRDAVELIGNWKALQMS
jgi:pyrimidine operon attenuation protein/uracil phosphoribosyltransferase